MNQKILEPESKKIQDSSLAKELDNIVSAEVVEKEKPLRRVILKYKSCCGCGCDWVDVERWVPEDSDLEHRDKITELLPGDEML
jgi:hypothetical protein